MITDTDIDLNDWFDAPSAAADDEQPPPPDDPPPTDSAPAPPPSGDHDTDSGNARRLVTAHGDQIRYVGAWGKWLTWDGKRWQRDEHGRIYELAKTVTRLVLEEANQHDGDRRQRLVKWAMQSEAATKIRAMVELARSDPRIAISPQQLDADPWLFNVKNGTIDLRTGTLRPHAQQDLITKIADVAHDPHAAAPLLTTFLEQILPDEEVRTFVQRWAGYCLSGDVTEHKILFAFGVGANGKSTLLNALAHIFGDYARQAAPDLLMRRRDDPHPTGLADLQGARLVLASETAQNRHLDEALVKRLTGGDRIKARHMYADFFEFAPTHKFVVATNHRPTVEGTDHGIWRRIRLVPFDVVIADDAQDRGLERKLLDEAAGILNWAIAGCVAWQHDGLTEPAAIVAATDEYRAAMDVLGDFISDCCVLADGLQAKASDLFKRYGEWCDVMGERAMTQRAFGLKLRERGLDKATSGVVWWRKIGLKATGDGPDGDESRTMPWDDLEESPGQQRFDGTSG